MIKIISSQILSEQQERRLRAVTRRLLRETGSVRSLTGLSLQFALEWFQENEHPFIIRGHPKHGYIISLNDGKDFAAEDKPHA